MHLLAHVSDPHLDGTPRSTERLDRVMTYLRGLSRPVDAVLVTGDIADNAAIAEYEEAARLLKAPFPVLVGPGNHDRRAPFRKGLLGVEPSDEPINSVHRIGDVAVLMLDSSIPGEDEGLLEPQTVEWADRTLADLGDTPAFLAFHHPPVVMHHPLPDTYLLQRADNLARLLDAHPNVVAVLTGHSHTAAASTFARRPLLVAPGITWTLRMPWEGGTGAADRDAPPGVAFHALGDDGSLITHYRVVY